MTKRAVDESAAGPTNAGNDRTLPPRVGSFVVKQPAPDATGAVRARAVGADGSPFAGQPAMVALSPREGPDERIADQVEAMLEVFGSLQETGFLPVLEAGVENGWAYLVQPPLPPPTLEERLERLGPLPPAAAERALGELADALALLHGRDLAHGDVRPAFVGFGADGRAVLGGLAFGRSSRIEPPTAAAPYLAPERRTGEPSPAADQFALAATLVAMLTGVAPRAMPPGGAPPTLDLGLPMGLAVAVARGLAPAPADRYPSVGTLVMAYREAAAAAADALVAGVWDTLEHRDYAMAVALIEGALRLRPDHREAALLLDHVRSLAPPGMLAVGMPWQTTVAGDPTRPLPDPVATLPTPPPAPPTRRNRPWLLVMVVTMVGVVAVIGLLVLVLVIG